MVLLMDEENNLMEETALLEDSSDAEFVCGDPKVEPRVGDEFQVEIPPMFSASERAVFLSTPPLALDDSSFSFLVGQPVQVMWIAKHPKGQANGDDDDDDVDMNQSLKSFRAKRSRCSAKSDKNPKPKKQRLNLDALPEIPSSSWEDHEVASFVLGLYTFGKNFTQVKKFMESKGTGEILLFYFGKFYKSASYHTWTDSRKKRSRKCVYGRKLYSGWRQQQLLSRLIPSVSDETQKQMLVNVSKSFAEGKISLVKYIDAVKDLVGLRLLVDAVAIGKGKDDLTVRTAVPVKTTKPWFTVSQKHSSVPGLRAYTSLTSADIITQLKGSSRLSKARCSDIFWEAVWPRLLARGWHSEQPNDRSYNTSKDNIVFIVPGVKRFSRGDLVKGDHYFDSVSDILTKVASEPELLEFEAGGVSVVAENSSDQSDEVSSKSDSQRHRYLKSPCSNRGNSQMTFTVVDTSLAAGGKLCDLRNLKAETIVSEPKTGLGDNVEMPQVMPLDAPMRFVIIDSSLDHRKKWSGLRRWKRLPSDGTNKDDSSIKEEESLERVKDPSKRLIKHKSTRPAETNHHSVKSAPSLKRRRLSACIKKEKSLSTEISESDHLRMVCPDSEHLSLCAVQHQNSTHEEMNEDKERYETLLSVDQSKKTRTEPSAAVVETQEIMSESKPNGLSLISGVDNNCSTEEVRTSHELIASEQDSKGACSVSGSEERCAYNDQGPVVKLPSITGANINISPSNYPEQEQAVELPSITDANIKSSPSNDLGNTHEFGSSQQQHHDQQANNTDAPRRHSTRKRPLTTRALEALESGFLTNNGTESTVKPRKRERSSKRKHSAKASARAQLLPDNGIADMEQRGEDGRSKATASNSPLDQIEDTKPSFILNGAKTESKPPLDRRHDSKPVLTEHPRLPPIILKLSLKRRASEA
ncbi:unnamed protein product [Eruca vesicaria subsp. sativa]|uniref:SANT domain-containing protein n=1 Tax=Eruca vesicaria subsp. sativa TaxID=29727 RepID=A0ABC8KJV9_ERUVS|nr:unnamed protein product [Eruca vesicaria subsp. sativa]